MRRMLGALVIVKNIYPKTRKYSLTRPVPGHWQGLMVKEKVGEIRLFSFNV